MPWMVKVSISMFFDSQTGQSSQIEACRIFGMTQNFEFEVLASKNIEFESFNVLGSCPWILKASIWM